jgi:hypothetical protein
MRGCGKPRGGAGYGMVRKVGYINRKLVNGFKCHQLPAESAGM